MSEYNILKLCKKVDAHYEFTPSVIFPATIGRIKEVLAGEAPWELVREGWNGIPWRDPVVESFIKEAETIQDWNSAEALAFAESWFKRALALKVGPPVQIHILKDLNYRR